MDSILRYAGIGYLAVLLLLWAYSFYKGRNIVEYLKRRHRPKWEDAGSPTPDYLNPIRLQRWRRFLSEEVYREADDRNLSEMCLAQNALERWTVTLTVIFFLVFGGIAAWQKYAG